LAFIIRIYHDAQSYECQICFFVYADGLMACIRLNLAGALDSNGPPFAHYFSSIFSLYSGSYCCCRRLILIHIWSFLALLSQIIKQYFTVDP